MIIAGLVVFLAVFGAVGLAYYLVIVIPWEGFKQVRGTRLYLRRARQADIGEPKVAATAFTEELFTELEPYPGKTRGLDARSAAGITSQDDPAAAGVPC